MKKMLLLSVVASTMIMAGGDIAPVEQAQSNWKFSGQGVAYYQTQDDFQWWSWGGDYSLFNQDTSFANAGLQLTATNDNLISGIGFGAQLNGLGTLGLEEDIVSNVLQTAGNTLNGAYFSQLYLTYGFGNTSVKVGRQELPKALSPFAFSEDWSVFKNTFDAALVVNTDLPDTVLVGAWVRDANYNEYYADMNDFGKLNGSNGVWMLTAQNKSVENLSLTGSWYFADSMIKGDNLNILWADAQYNAGIANIGLQGGTVMSDGFTNDANAFGAQVSGKINMINASVAFSHVNDSDAGIFNVGGTTSVLYTDMLAEQLMTYPYQNDNNKFVVRADMDALGGNVGAAYGYADFGDDTNTKEFDLTYKTNITENINVAATYEYFDCQGGKEPWNTIRLVGRYNF